MDQQPSREGEGEVDASRQHAEEVSASSEPFVCWDVALDATGGDQQLLADVLDAFCQEAPLLLANIRRAQGTRDAKLLHRAAHTIKNAFESLGAQATSEVAWQIEQAGRAEDFQLAADLTPRLEQDLAGVMQEIRQYLRARRFAADAELE